MHNSKRIVIDARIINSSTGRYVERLLHYLEQIDSINTYSVLVPIKDRDFWVPKNKNFVVVTTPYKNYSLSEQIGFMKQLYDLNADLVHFCMPQQPLFYTKNHITTIHDLTLLKTYNSDKNWLVFHLKQLVGRVLFYVIGHTSSQIIAISEHTKQEYIKHSRIPQSKVTLTYEAADTLSDTPRRPTILKDLEPYIMYVGQQSDYKNIRRLIEAHQKLRGSYPSLKLILVGSLNEAARRNKTWSESRGHEGVVFTGFLPDDELAWLYGHTRAYVFPSLMEGFGLPGLEAMIHGAPVVSSNTTCLPEVYGDAAKYFDPYSVDDIAKVIDTLLGEEVIRTKLIEAGKKQAARYSWERMARQTKAVYESTFNE